MKLKAPSKIQISIFIFSIVIFLLNIFQGSNINFTRDSCFPISLEYGILVFTSVTLVLLFLSKRGNEIKRILLPIFIASSIIYFVEPQIFNYQMDCTNKNLESICNFIEKYKSENGVLPNKLDDLGRNENFNTGFKIFNNEFQYQKEENENFNILYEVKFGAICEAWNCSTHFSNLKYTCVGCGAVHNEILNKKNKSKNDSTSKKIN